MEWTLYRGGLNFTISKKYILLIQKQITFLSFLFNPLHGKDNLSHANATIACSHNLKIWENPKMYEVHVARSWLQTVGTIIEKEKRVKWKKKKLR